METKNYRIRNFVNKICLCNNRFRVNKIDQKKIYEHGLQEMAAKVPIRRMGKPEEVARLVLWLASNENTFASAQNIAIDGGFTRV